jgi:hypothetical protein
VVTPDVTTGTPDTANAWTVAGISLGRSLAVHRLDRLSADDWRAERAKLRELVLLADDVPEGDLATWLARVLPDRLAPVPPHRRRVFLAGFFFAIDLRTLSAG